MEQTTTSNLILPILGDKNYCSWALQIQRYLRSQNLWDCVNGTWPKATTPSNEWVMADCKAGTIIISYTHPLKQHLIAEFDTSKDMWDHLKAAHESQTANRLQDLLTDFY